MISSPQWTSLDKEIITQFIFEKIQAPGLCFVDSAMAAMWGYGIASGTVIDVGFEKTEITPVIDFVVSEHARETLDVGGDTMTKHLSKILGGEANGWGYDMAEQLKCSNICEILDPSKNPIPGTETADPVKEPAKKGRKPKDIEMDDDKDDGILNIAEILNSDRPKEILAQKEKERQDALRGAQKNFPNFRKERNTFYVIEKRKEGDVDVVMSDDPEVEITRRDTQTTEKPQENGSATGSTNGIAAATEAPQQQPSDSTGSAAAAQADVSGSNVPSAPADSTSNSSAVAAPAMTDAQVEEERQARERAEEKAKRKDEKRSTRESELRPFEVRRQVEVGVERFKAAECGIFLDIADAVHRALTHTFAVMVPPLAQAFDRRQEVWDNIIVVGNGARIKGKLPAEGEITQY